MKPLSAKHLLHRTLPAALLGTLACAPTVSDSGDESEPGRSGGVGGSSAGAGGKATGGGSAPAAGQGAGGGSSTDGPRPTAGGAGGAGQSGAGAGGTGGTPPGGPDAGSSIPVTPGPLSPILPVVFLDVPGYTANQNSTMPPTIGFTKRDGRMKIVTAHDGMLKDAAALKASPAALEAPIGISKRGSSSGGFPQVSFSVEIRDAMKMEMKLGVLGMPAEADWALVACWNDKTCMRHALAYEMGRAMGPRWQPRSRFVEVYFNDSYRGLYLLVEPPRQDKNRVAIPKPATDATGGMDALSGGYIFRREAGGKASPTANPARDWLSPEKDPSGRYQMVYTYHYPREADITAAQKTYLRDYMASFERAMKAPDWSAAYPSWIDVDTFIEFALINEVANNVDGYWKSMYMTKLPDAGGARGKLQLTPFWDFNIAFGNADYRDGWKLDNWTYKLNRYFGECTSFLPAPMGCAACKGYDAMCTNMPYVPFWWDRIWSDKAFQDKLKCAWQRLRKPGAALATDSANKLIAAWQAQLRPNIARHYAKWPDLRTKVWPNPCDYDAATKAFRPNSRFKLPGLPDPNCGAPSLSPEAFLDFESKWLEEWTRLRAEWLDKSLPGTCAM